MSFLKRVQLLQPGLRQLFRIAARRCFVGVRMLAIRNGDEVLLLRHTYKSGWHFPGGGADPGEPPGVAAVRELREETGVIAHHVPALFGAYIGRYMGADNYVLVYVLTDFEEGPWASPEIAEIGWFKREALPPDTTGSTRRRISEYFEKAPRTEFW